MGGADHTIVGGCKRGHVGKNYRWTNRAQITYTDRYLAYTTGHVNSESGALRSLTISTLLAGSFLKGWDVWAWGTAACLRVPVCSISFHGGPMVQPMTEAIPDCMNTFIGLPCLRY
jgi:hypothetical protein